MKLRYPLPLLAATAWIALLTLLHGTASRAQAQNYAFTRITDSTGAFSILNRPAIAPNGTLVLHASQGNMQHIVTGNGGPLTIIADNSASGPYLGFGDALINGAGTIAFIAGRRTGGLSFFAVNGATTTTIASTVGAGGPFTSISLPSGADLNDSGTVAFGGEVFNGPQGIFAGSGGPTVTIADSNGPLSTFFATVSINDAGTVAFRAELDGGGAGIFAGNGGGLTTIADSNSAFDANFSSPAINASGTVAFAAGLDAGGGGIFTGSGSVTLTLADTSGPFGNFFTGQLISINASGTVLFPAALDSGVQGIFVGPNPATDKVIALGDALDGSTVTFLGFGSNALNDAGQIGFVAALQDGRTAVFRADIIPEPSSAALLALSILLGASLLLWRRIQTSPPSAQTSARSKS